MQNMKHVVCVCVCVSVQVAPHEQTSERKCLQLVWAEAAEWCCVCWVWVCIAGCSVCCSAPGTLCFCWGETNTAESFGVCVSLWAAQGGWVWTVSVSIKWMLNLEPWAKPWRHNSPKTQVEWFILQSNKMQVINSESRTYFYEVMK